MILSPLANRSLFQSQYIGKILFIMIDMFRSSDLGLDYTFM